MECSESFCPAWKASDAHQYCGRRRVDCCGGRPGWALHGWFRLSIHRFNSVAAKDVLAAWDAELAKLSADDRERLRAQPPVAVLDALVELPSPRHVDSS